MTLILCIDNRAIFKKNNKNNMLQGLILSFMTSYLVIFGKIACLYLTSSKKKVRCNV